MWWGTRKSKTLCGHIVTTTLTKINQFLLGLGTHIPPINDLPQINHVVCQGMRKTCKLKVRQYDDCTVNIDVYLTVLPGGKSSGKFGGMSLNGIFLNSMPN